MNAHSADPDRLPAAVIVARLSSRRLPGKVLRDVEGRPLLSYIVERLERCRAVGAVCVATSALPADDPIAGYCARRAIRCHRASLHDVAGRVLYAAEQESAAAFFRVNGDSPFIPIELMERALGLFRAEQPDIVTNVHPRTCPPGASVELLSTGAFRRAAGGMRDPADREHVTRYLYQHAGLFRICSLPGNGCHGDVRLAVDTAEDLAMMRRAVRAMDRPHWEYTVHQMIELYRGLSDERRSR